MRLKDLTINISEQMMELTSDSEFVKTAKQIYNSKDQIGPEQAKKNLIKHITELQKNAVKKQ